MSQTEIIKRYLRSREEVQVEPTGLPFVTISRQAGAGGHMLARKILRLMDKQRDEEWARGWEMFDHQLCLLVAQDPKLKSSFESLLAEEYRPESFVMLSEIIAGESRQHIVNKRIFEIVRILATLGKVVIVGRAGSFITRDLGTGIHIRLIAPEPHRVRNIREFLYDTDAAARAGIRKQDRDRARLVRDYFNTDITDPLNYDAVWNTGQVSLDDIAAAVVQMLARRAKSKRA
jgi:cytidylate kinase